MENGVTASGASAAVFTNPRLLICSWERLPKYPLRFILTTPPILVPKSSSITVPHSAPVHRWYGFRRDVSSLRLIPNLQSACGVAPSRPRGASLPIAPAPIRLRDNSPFGPVVRFIRSRSTGFSIRARILSSSDGRELPQKFQIRVRNLILISSQCSGLFNSYGW